LRQNHGYENRPTGGKRKNPLSTDLFMSRKKKEKREGNVRTFGTTGRKG